MTHITARKVEDLVTGTDVLVEFTDGSSSFGRIKAYRRTADTSVWMENDSKMSIFLSGNEHVRSTVVLSPNAPAKHLESLGRIWVGSRVSVRKYGNRYSGRITRINRTTVDVSFRLANGDLRERTFRVTDITSTER